MSSETRTIPQTFPALSRMGRAQTRAGKARPSLASTSPELEPRDPRYLGSAVVPPRTREVSGKATLALRRTARLPPVLIRRGRCGASRRSWSGGRGRGGTARRRPDSSPSRPTIHRTSRTTRAVPSIACSVRVASSAAPAATAIRPAPAWTVIAPIPWPTMSCRSRAIRSRSAQQGQLVPQNGDLHVLRIPGTTLNSQTSDSACTTRSLRVRCGFDNQDLARKSRHNQAATRRRRSWALQRAVKSIGPGWPVPHCPRQHQEREQQCRVEPGER